VRVLAPGRRPRSLLPPLLFHVRQAFPSARCPRPTIWSPPAWSATRAESARHRRKASASPTEIPAGQAPARSLQPASFYSTSEKPSLTVKSSGRSLKNTRSICSRGIARCARADLVSLRIRSVSFWVCAMVVVVAFPFGAVPCAVPVTLMAGCGRRLNENASLPVGRCRAPGAA